jgi:hypothetical protein
MKFDCDKPEDHADYTIGAQARFDDKPFDPNQPQCWQEGWNGIDEELKANYGLRQPY